MTARDMRDYLNTLTEDQLDYKVISYGDDGVYNEFDRRSIEADGERKILLFNTEVDYDLMDEEEE